MITTCVILNYNDYKTTVSLVNSIVNFNSIDYIVVVDNKSTDNSFFELKKIESNKVHLILADFNGGYGYGNNLGVLYSFNKLNAEYTLIANPDVYFSEKTVLKLRKILHEIKDAGISAPVPVKPSGQHQKRPAWMLPTITQEVLSASILISKLFSINFEYKNSYFLENDLCIVDVVQGSLLMVKTNIMTQFGMYDQEFFLYGEEQVIAKKFKENGYKTFLLTSEEYIHDHSTSINKSYKNLIKKRILLFKSKLLYLEKYMKVNKFKLVFIKLFFNLLLIESFIASIYLSFFPKSEN